MALGPTGHILANPGSTCAEFKILEVTAATTKITVPNA
jgi:hypothetical protein